MMGAILLFCGYIKCNDGSFNCEVKFPDISHVMGRPPLNKLYAIMLTIYSCVKQAYVRAYYERLKGIASAGTNKNLVIYGAISCIFGPCIGYYDVYYDTHIHSAATALFVIGELLYVITIISVLNKSKIHWPTSVHGSIENLFYSEIVVLTIGGIKMITKALSISLGSYGAYIEWIAFIWTFYVFSVLSDIMPCESVIVPVKEEENKN